MNNDQKKALAERNPRVNLQQLRQSQDAMRVLRQSSSGSGSSYRVDAPYRSKGPSQGSLTQASRVPAKP